MRKIYRLIITFLVLLHILLFTSLTCFSQDEEVKKGTLPPKKISSLQKSLLLPGWGQITEKRYLEGILFLSAEVFCLYKVISYNHKSNDYYSLYKNADNVSDALEYRDLTENYDHKRNRFILAVAGVWIINLIDIYFIVKKKDKKERNLKIKLKHNENKDLAFTITFSF
jgi:hypothetical protein